MSYDGRDYPDNFVMPRCSVCGRESMGFGFNCQECSPECAEYYAVRGYDRVRAAAMAEIYSGVGVSEDVKADRAKRTARIKLLEGHGCGDPDDQEEIALLRKQEQEEIDRLCREMMALKPA
jgi:hypothetical protein